MAAFTLLEASAPPTEALVRHMEAHVRRTAPGAEAAAHEDQMTKRSSSWNWISILKTCAKHCSQQSQLLLLSQNHRVESEGGQFSGNREMGCRCTTNQLRFPKRRARAAAAAV